MRCLVRMAVVVSVSIGFARGAEPGGAELNPKLAEALQLLEQENPTKAGPGFKMLLQLGYDRAYKPTAADGVRLLRETARNQFPMPVKAAEPPPSPPRPGMYMMVGGGGPPDVERKFLDLAAKRVHAEYAPVIVEIYPKVAERHRNRLIAILHEIPENAGADSVLELVRRHANDGTMNGLELAKTFQSNDYARRLLPELLKLSAADSIRDDVYEAVSDYVRRDDAPKLIAPYLTRMVQECERALADARRFEASPGNLWMRNSKYPPVRDRACVLLTMLSFGPADQVNAAIRDGLRSRDPRVQYFAVESLLRLSQDVPADALLAVAASPQWRRRLWSQLSIYFKGGLFPQEFRTHQAFAETAMVEELQSFRGIGRVPDEIEFMQVFTGKLKSGEERDYYLFRFRTRNPDGSIQWDWMAGVVGPVDREGEPTRLPTGLGNSLFDAWADRTPRAHVLHIFTESLASKRSLAEVPTLNP